MPKIRVLIVDDSVVVRRQLTKAIESDPTIEVVGTAANGKIAIAKIPLVNPDLIILDVVMPEMDGLATLAAIRQQDRHIPIVMFSAITQTGAAATIEALSLGATDYVTKPHNTKTKEEAIQQIQDQLIAKIKVFCNRAVEKVEKSDSERLSNFSSVVPPRLLSLKSQIQIVAIGSSTGGPNALEAILSQLPANFPVPIVIAQHMPPVFTQRLAERLTNKCKIRVCEAEIGTNLVPGVALIAPGDYHMLVEKIGNHKQILTNQNSPENSCRPAVDVLFRSVAKIYGAGTLGVILTGMGHDGLEGCRHIHAAGGQIIVQDEATSVVWGMPGIVANSGLADRILPLEKIAAEIISRV